MADWQALLLGSFLENKWLRFLFILVVFYVLSKILQVIVFANLRRLTRKTKTQVDDLLLDRLRKPLVAFLTLIGAKIAFNTLALSVGVSAVFQNIFNSLMILTAMFAVMGVAAVLIRAWGEKWANKTKSTIDDDLLPLFKRAANVTIIIVASFFILAEWNIDVTGLLAGVGVAGLAIGFAVKDSLANIFGGISLILDKAFKVGDPVKLEDGSAGRIVDVGLRSTRIRTWNNELLVIPNGQLANGVIQNYQQPDLSVRCEVNFGVEYGSDVKKVKKVVADTIKKIKTTVLDDPKKPIQVLFLNMGDSALEFRARFWVNNFSERFLSQEEATEMIYNALTQSKVGIPFPTRTVYLKKE